MLDFDYAVSTRVFFGKNKIERLGDEITTHARRVLFVYGHGSIKKTGLYDNVVKLLEKNHVVFQELSGVKSNPSVTSVREGVKLCKQHDLRFLLAVGGGSVIDCAKTIAAGMYCEGDPWKLFLEGDEKIKQALPIGTVLTTAGSGSEMNGNAVISNEETEQKLAIHKDVLRPKFSILDPTYTFSVSRDQTAAGTVDIFSHVLEQYFSPTKESFLQDRLAEALMKTVIRYGSIALNEPLDYEARASLMWASSLALNGILSYGKITDWATHGIEHAISASYDVTHGVGLAVLTPFWMEYVLHDTEERCATYARNVWGVKGRNNRVVAKKGIKKTREFFKSLGMPQRLRDVGVKEEKLSSIAEKIVLFGEIGKVKKLGKNEVLTILENAF